MNALFVGREGALKKAGEMLGAARSDRESVVCLEGSSDSRPCSHESSASGRLARITRAGAPYLPDAPLDAIRNAGVIRREREVFECLVEGLTDKEIGATLNISPYAVENHLRNIYAKSKCANRGEPAHRARTLHFVRVTTDEGPDR